MMPHSKLKTWEYFLPSLVIFSCKGVVGETSSMLSFSKPKKKKKKMQCVHNPVYFFESVDPQVRP